MSKNITPYKDSELGKKEILNDQLYITVQFQLVDFMKTLQVNLNSYQRKQFLQFFDDLMRLPPYSVQLFDQKFRKLLFFPKFSMEIKWERLNIGGRAWHGRHFKWFVSCTINCYLFDW